MNKVIVLKARPPVEGGDTVGAEISRAHRYYNRLVELHREFRAATDAARRCHVPGLGEAEQAVEDAEAALDDLRAQVKARNAVARRKIATVVDQAAITAARQVLADARAERKRLRGLAADCAAYQEALAALVVEYHGVLPEGSNRRQGGHFKEARAACGVYWGTYLRIEAAVEAAVKTSRGGPRFRSWTGDGLIGPQVVPPLPVSAALVGPLGLDGQERVGWSADAEVPDQRLRIEVLPSPASDRRSRRLLVWVRVQSEDRGKSPVWCRVPAHLSRGQLPADAVITWATVVRRQVGVRRHRDPEVPGGVYRPYYEWAVHLTIRTAETKPRASCGACGVNLGWRVLPDGGLRVGYVVGDDGACEELRLPPRLVERWGMARGIQSIRDRHFDEARDALATWLASTPDLPAWLVEATEYLHQWRSKRRLGAVQGRWARQRFGGDEEAFTALSDWRQRDVHLEQYALMLERKARRARLALHRAIVSDLRRRYRVVVVDATCQRQLVRLPTPESNETVNATARYHARIAAPAMLRSLLVQSGAVASDPTDVSRTCHVCRSVEAWDQAAEVVHTCSACGATWDQDANAARNLLARAGAIEATPDTARPPEDGDGPADAPTAVATGGKWARRKADRSRKATETAVTL